MNPRIGPQRSSRKLTLWVERGFSRREITERMLRAAPRLTLISTPEQPLPDTQVLELPSFEDDFPAALELADRLILEHGIDALWLQNSAVYDLSSLGCTVHRAATPEVIALVEDKSRFSEWLGDDPVRADAVEVVGAEAVAKEYYRRRNQGREVCIKPAVGANSSGYWRLTESVTASSLLERPHWRMAHPDVYLAVLGLEGDDQLPQRLLMMDWLPGPEVSIDVLCWEGVPLVHAARTMLGGHRQLIQSEHPMLEHARDITQRLAMHGIVSVQYKADQDGNWRMLEINPRPAGGSVKSEDAGFGIIAGWARLVAGVAGPQDIKQYSGEVTVVAKPAIQILSA